MNQYDTSTELAGAIDRHRAAYETVSQDYSERADREEALALDALLALPVRTIADIRTKATYLASLPPLSTT